MEEPSKKRRKNINDLFSKIQRPVDVSDESVQSVTAWTTRLMKKYFYGICDNHDQFTAVVNTQSDS